MLKLAAEANMMNMRHRLKYAMGLLMCLVAFNINAQQICVGFYNVENLFDTLHDVGKNDHEYLPDGKNSWNSERYANKLDRLSEAILLMGDGKVGPDILGLCEVENENCLRDLALHPKLQKSQYAWILVEGPDNRGIDVALIYRKDRVRHLAVRSVPLSADSRSRDQLWVRLLTYQDTLDVIVNHWPSRLGGQERSEPNRIAAAKVCRSIVDTILSQNPMSKIILMGDFNDDPTDSSILYYLAPEQKSITNVAAPLFAQGQGTLTYRGQWNLFDQMLVSDGLQSDQAQGFKFVRYEIVKAPVLLEQGGKYDGNPKRTMAGGNYLNGYSDHLPVRLFLSK